MTMLAQEHMIVSQSWINSKLEITEGFLNGNEVALPGKQLEEIGETVQGLGEH